MAFSTVKLKRQSSLLMLPAVAKLAWKRLKRTWGLLFFTWLGMVAMLVLVCAVPLFSRVATSADLRDLARTTEGGTSITVTQWNNQLATDQMQQSGQQIDQLFHSFLGPYLGGNTQLSVKTPALQILDPRTNAPDLQNQLAISGFDSAQLTSQFTLVQGRLPQTAGDALEIAVTQKGATALGLHLGSLLQARLPGAANSAMLKLHVVGIIAVQATAGNIWQAPYYAPPHPNDPDQYDGVTVPPDGTVLYNALTFSQALLPQIGQLQPDQSSSSQPKGGDPQQGFGISWSYPLDMTRVTVDNVSTLLDQYQHLQNQIYSSGPGINGSFTGIRAPFLDSLQGYAIRNAALQVGTILLLIMILGLALFTVSMLSTVLVERQNATIAVLRSRGATRRHIFGAFVLQGLGLGLTALLAGPLLALLLVAGITRVLISPLDLPALSSITSDPVQAALQVKWYALITVIFAFLVLVLAVRRATKLDIVALRQESARTTHKPFWRRIHLDLILSGLVCLGYVYYVYLVNQAADQHVIIHQLTAPLAYIAAPATLVALLLLFMRLFPLILRLGLKLSTRGRRASSVLAFAQMDRIPRAVSRLILLLAVAVAGSCYLLTFMSTMQQRPVDTTAYQVGADFSGSLSVHPGATTSPQDLEATYRAQAGVLAATVGYHGDVQSQGRGNLNTIHIAAIDADTYAQTAIWSPQYAQQPLSILTGQLVAHRANAAGQDAVYALVDASMWQSLQLTPGASFSLPVSGDSGQVHFIALAKINTFPSFYDSSANPYFGVGLVVDYQSYAAVFAKDNPGSSVQPNYVWLRTSDDAASLAGIHHAWPELSDRRALLTAAQTDPLQINTLGVLGIGTATALVLALLGTLIATWLSTSNRLTNFAVLRAIGMAPRQVASILAWEQSVVYLIALLLGLGLGAVLTVFVTPAFYLLDLVGSPDFPQISDVLPIHTVIPFVPIGLMLGCVTLICAGTLALMARIAASPSVSQTLRLSED